MRHTHPTAPHPHPSPLGNTPASHPDAPPKHPGRGSTPSAGPAPFRDREPLTMRLLAEPSAIAYLRRRVRELFADWGLPEYADTAQLCVSELAANVVTHVGTGVPVTLQVSMAADRPRIALTDPDPRALPVLLAATEDAESGRGLALLDALTLRWGVDQHPDSKTTWCELAP